MNLCGLFDRKLELVEVFANISRLITRLKKSDKRSICMMRELNTNETKKVNGGISAPSSPIKNFNDQNRKDMEEFAKRILEKLEG